MKRLAITLLMLVFTNLALAATVLGNPKGTVSMVEFFDYQCPACKSMQPVVEKLVQKTPYLRVVMVDFPVNGDNSVFAARAAAAAGMQGKFKEMHDALINDKNPLTSDEILKIAKSIGLNVDQFQNDMNA